MDKNLYEILQVDHNASSAVIQGAYRALLKDARIHPDLGGSEQAAKAINEAYAILGNAETRREYDQTIAQYSPEGAPSQPSHFLVFCPSCRRRNLLSDERGLALARCNHCGRRLRKQRARPRENDDKRAYRVGLFLFDKSMYDRARWEFQTAVRLQPRNPVYHYWLARTNYQKRSLESARAAFKTAALLNPGQFHYRFWLGQCCYAMRDFAGAAEGFAAAARLRPRHQPTLLRLGMSYFRLGIHEKAIGPLEMAAVRGALRMQPLAWLGLSHLALHNREAALEAFRRAERISPGNSFLQKYIALCRPGESG